MKKRDIISCLFLQTILVFTFIMISINTQASSNTHTHDETVESEHHEFVSGAEEQAQEKEVVHGERAWEHLDKDIDHDHQAEVPLVYLFYWGILILVMVMILIYFVYRRKNKKLKPMIPLAVFLVLFAIAIYGLEIITPVFSGRFDPKTLTIIHQFHEAPNIGFLRFIYKFILGILMTFFAFLNLDRNDFNKKSMEDQG